MELEKFMERRNISKEYIAKAAKTLNDICRRCACEDCPLHLNFVCALTTSADVPIEECVREGLESYLNKEGVKHE